MWLQRPDMGQSQKHAVDAGCTLGLQRRHRLHVRGQVKVILRHSYQFSALQ